VTPAPVSGGRSADGSPCLWCEQTPANGAWNRPCPDAPDRLHYTREQFAEIAQERLNTVGGDLRRAAFELERAANAVAALPPRVRRKIERAQPLGCLDPILLQNEAERARDTLHVYGLLDV
jgi:hypothetical protein